MSRYPEWAAYKARTGMLLPRFRRSARDQPGAGDADAQQAAAGDEVRAQ